MRARTRDEVHGPRSGYIDTYRADGGAVALLLELWSCHPTLSDENSAPFSSNTFQKRNSPNYTTDRTRRDGPADARSNAYFHFLYV